jgi:hypothetical protein
MLSEEFKEKAAKLQERLQENITNRELYNLIEGIVMEDPEMKKWLEE